MTSVSWVQANKMPFIQKLCPKKIAPMSLMSGIGPEQWTSTGGRSFSFNWKIIENV